MEVRIIRLLVRASRQLLARIAPKHAAGVVAAGCTQWWVGVQYLPGMPMRRVTICSLVTVVVALAACSNASSSTPNSAPADTTPAGTVPPPGNCVAGEVLPTVTLVVDGKSVDPTFGLGSSECATLTGTGYIAFDYDPILIDTAKAIEVVVVGDGKVTLAWPGGEPFTQTKPGHWQSSVPSKGCSQLTIALVSPSGTSTETLGADVRIGGTGVPCPQRGLGPTEPIDTKP